MAQTSRPRTRLVQGTALKLGFYPGSTVVLGPQRPAEIVNSGQVGGAPAILAGALSAAAAISLAVALSASVRRRRHELALLRSMGFTRRQLAGSVVGQATATVVVAIAIGVPLGIVLGRTLWGAFACHLDAVAEPTIPVLTLVAVIAAALVVANVAALLPARAAARIPTVGPPADRRLRRPTEGSATHTP